MLFRFVPLTFVPLILPFLAVAANFCMKAYEIPRNRGYIVRAKRKIAESNCLKIGITGSFAKTSVKHFAAAIAGSKYRVAATPASYNTPMGVARTVFEQGLDCDLFFVEMGARRRGDIQELCDMVSPEIGVVTGICPQHLETFLTIENNKEACLRKGRNSVCSARLPPIFPQVTRLYTEEIFLRRTLF